ncbi:uncharacterized protein CEXT_532191 [Caerostris extrusa]|uniref:EGF-like domain-containing protein n=1 Tax=Caerostris extrusa TaxID=172846 RepID=A0AAV4N8A3_CAEEX|nr:uncharacterized protein CEXT_532191 [Caerostris extrusa]
MLFSEADPCLKDIKHLNCGPETECKRIEGKGFNYKCTCSPGFESYKAYHPLADKTTVIHYCQDVNECLDQKACPNRTRCLNTYGGHDCICSDGFRPSMDKSVPPKIDCVEICDPKLCRHGKCEVIGDTVGCRCDDGYMGLIANS